jgi:pimeloyl-ACP methyl ester carboxylesterase
VFQPGAKVDPRAYVPLLRQVAAQGYLVVIVQQPYDIGFLAVADPGNVISSNPTVARWAVGGHSLGGVAAAAYAGRQGSNVRGLLLWAAYPVGSLADRTDLVVASVSGTADGLTTPSDIEESRANLPPSTQFTAVEGAVHAYFGDYGEQSGDGTPTVDRGTAQQQIVAASTRFLAEVANG